MLANETLHTDVSIEKADKFLKDLGVTANAKH
jgi:hypothetical protein